MENIENSDILKAELKSILAYKAKEGATFQDVQGNLQKEYKFFLTKNKIYNHMVAYAHTHLQQ